MGAAGWEWVRRMRNSECGIVRVETARGRIVVFQYKKRLWWALFIDAIFCIEMCGYPENLSLWRRNSCINTRALYAVVTNPIARKGIQRGEDPLAGSRGSALGFSHKHAEVVCKCAQFNRAKGSGEQLPCGVKGQRPLGHSCHTFPSDRSQPTTSICHADSSAEGVRMAEISP